MTEIDKKEAGARKIIEAIRAAKNSKAELATLCFGMGLEAAVYAEQQPQQSA